MKFQKFNFTLQNIFHTADIKINDIYDEKEKKKKNGGRRSIDENELKFRREETDLFYLLSLYFGDKNKVNKNEMREIEEWM